MDPEPAREEALAGSLLGQVPVVCVSGVTGAGLDELSAALVTGLPAPDVEANVRLWVDRAFTMHGAGTLASETATSWSWVPEAGGWWCSPWPGPSSPPLGGDSARLELASELLLRVRDRGLLRDPGYPAHPCRDHRAGGAPAGAAPPRGSGRPRSRTVHDEAVAEHAAANPLEPGMPLETARQITGMPDTRLVELLLGQQLTVTDGRVHTAGPVQGLPSAVRRAIDEIRAELTRRPFAAPEPGRLAELGLGTTQLAAAVRAGELLKIADGIHLAPGADDAAAERLRGLPRPFALSQARQALDTTRRIAISMPSAGPPASTARADCLPTPPDGPPCGSTSTRPCGSTSTRPCGSTSTKPTRRDRVPPSFGQIWTTGYPTHTEVLPNVPHLVVSSDLYNESGLGVLVVEIDSHEMRDPELHELIPGIGTVMLDRLAWYPQNWLREHIGDLPDNRHTELGRLIRNLIRP